MSAAESDSQEKVLPVKTMVVMLPPKEGDLNLIAMVALTGNPQPYQKEKRLKPWRQKDRLCQLSPDQQVSAELNHNQIATTAILLLMKYFQEKEDSIFILADVIIF